jgi:hypothetical protein
MTKLKKAVSREPLSEYRHYRKTIVSTLFDDCVSLRLKGTRRANAYELLIAHLMDDLCRRGARRRIAEQANNRQSIRRAFRGDHTKRKIKYAKVQNWP